MKCIIPGINIKVFARAINSLAKIGDELYLEPFKDGISFHTVNSSRSAFASYIFNKSFFSHYEEGTNSSSPTEDNVKCKVAMKACANAFKSLSSIEKSIEKCTIVIDGDEDKLILHMCCHHGIVKIYNLSFIECETLKAVYDSDAINQLICSQSRVLSEAVLNFQSALEEITLSVSPEKTLFRNYVDDEPDPSKAIHTELTLTSDEYDDYKIRGKSEVTFCLKELRALLYFSEPLNLPVNLVFTEPGNPLILSVKNQNLFTVKFVLATLASNLSSQMPDSSQTKDAAHSKSNTHANKQTETHNDTSYSIAREHNSNSHSVNGNSSLMTNIKGAVDSSLLRNDNPVSKSCNKVSTPFLKSNCNTKQISNSNQSLQESPLPPSHDPPSPSNCTPPLKKSRFFFQRCFEPTFDPNSIHGCLNVLAEDSGDES